MGQRIAAVAGSALSEEVTTCLNAGLRLDECEARVLGGHNLPTNFVVFVSSPIFNRQASPYVAKSRLCDTVKNVLRMCAKRGIETVTLPSIGSGAAGYDKGDAAKWIVKAIGEYLEEEAAQQTQQLSLQEVCFCFFDELSLDAYKEGILALEGDGGKA